MNERIRELANEAGLPTYNPEGVPTKLEKFAELIAAEAFRAGMLYSAKKYSEVGQERVYGSDVSLFLEMEAAELTDDEIKQHFGVE